MYLRALIDQQTEVHNFFGDWFEILGISDAGYFLGTEFIKELHKKHSVKFIAQLPFNKITDYVISFLKAGGDNIDK